MRVERLNGSEHPEWRGRERRRSRHAAGLMAALSLVAACRCGDGAATSRPEEEPPPPAPQEAVIVLNPAIQHQRITGWEMHAQSGHEQRSFPLFRDELFDRAVEELGINRIRLETWSGGESRTDWYVLWRSGEIDDQEWRCNRFGTDNDNDDPGSIDWSGFHFSKLDSSVVNVVLPIKQRLAARGETLFLNVTYVAFTRQIDPAVCGREYHHDDPEEYAEFVLATHLHLRDQFGLVPDTWEVILEPDNTDYWEGTEIGEAIVAAAARLRAHGFQTRFIAPSNANMDRAITDFDALIAVPGARDHLAELAYHRYSGVSRGNLEAINERRALHGIQTSMLEHIGSGYEDLHEDLKVANVSAWQQFALAFPDADFGGLYYPLDLSDPLQPRIRVGDRTKFLRNYFQYIRRDALRIGATSRDESFDPLAFVNADGGHVVVVKAERGGDFPIFGLPAGRYGINYATGGDNWNVEGPERTISAGEVLMASIPDDGVATVYRKQ